MITTIKYPDEQDQKQKVYRAIKGAIKEGAQKLDVSVVLKIEDSNADILKSICEDSGAEVNLFDCNNSNDDQQQQIIEIQNKLLTYLVRNHHKLVLDAMESFGLTLNELKEVLK